MHIAENARAAAITRLEIRPVLKSLLLGELEIGPFAEFFSKPHCFYAQGWPDNPARWPVFDGRQLLGLWEHRTRIHVVDLSSSPDQYLWFYAECPEEFRESRSLDEAIFDMLYLHVWEFGGGVQEAEEALHFARQVELPGMSRLALLLGDCEGCSDQAIADYRISLGASTNFD